MDAVNTPITIRCPSPVEVDAVEEEEEEPRVDASRVILVEAMDAQREGHSLG